MSMTSESPTEFSAEDGRVEAFTFPPESSSSASSPSKKPQRPTAIYPNTNAANKPQKPFSRSAAKRESVMALGSIEYLQHYFTKSGLAAKQNPLKPNSGSIPAIGGTGHKPIKPSLGSISEFNLPPSPAIPVFRKPQVPHVEKNYETNPENLKPGVIHDLIQVSSAWFTHQLEDQEQATDHENRPASTQSSTELDVLAILKTTTGLIRSVRNYVVSLPDDSGGKSISQRAQFRAPSYNSPIPTRRTVSNPLNSPSQSPDPLALIRKSAIDVLSSLRALEERARIPLSDDAYDAQSDHTGESLPTPGLLSPSRSPAPSEDQSSPSGSVYGGHVQDSSIGISIMSIPGRSEAVTVWDDEEEFSFSDLDDDKPPREIWDDRLVLGSGWLYRKDMKLESLVKERGAVRRYLDTVDDALFGGFRDGKRGWERAANELASVGEVRERNKARGSRRSSYGTSPVPLNGRLDIAENSLDKALGDLSLTVDSIVESQMLGEIEEDEEDEEDIVDDDRLPQWAKRTSFTDRPLARAKALLIHLLPVELLSLLPTSSESDDQHRSELLAALSSGQLLCVAYNAGVRRSRKPWGYIDKDSIHDVAALEAHARSESQYTSDAEKRNIKGWTFRRTDNLRLWVAAMKIRYLLPFNMPSSLPVAGNRQLPTNHPPSSAAVTPTGSPLPTKTQFSGISSPGLASSMSTPSVSVSAGSTSRHAEAAPAAILFDAKIVAHKDEGWESMLENALLRWVGAVVEEKQHSS